MWSGARLTKPQATSRPDHLWPELWTKLGRCKAEGEAKNGQLRNPKLDNADPEDKEFKETIRNARKKLKTPVAPASPCKTCKKSKNGETRSKTNDFKSQLACILEAWPRTTPPQCNRLHDRSRTCLRNCFRRARQARRIRPIRGSTERNSTMCEVT